MSATCPKCRTPVQYASGVFEDNEGQTVFGRQCPNRECRHGFKTRNGEVYHGPVH